MARKEDVSGALPVRNRYELVLDQYAIALSVVMMLFGLRQWAVIVGILPGAGGTFEAMSTAWKIVTMHMAVVDLVAAVGLWMRVAWGRVIWVYAALSEIAFHTVFIGTFGSDLPKVAFHLSTLAVFLVLTLLARHRAAA
ncbi:MAG: DUF6163 family protein [Bauldia sp.]|nr:DUF6163 family protein [Bauldia sp.]